MECGLPTICFGNTVVDIIDRNEYRSYRIVAPNDWQSTAIYILLLHKEAKKLIRYEKNIFKEQNRKF